MMETMIPPQVGMRLRMNKIKKEKKEKGQKKRRPKKEKKRKQKNERKRENGQCYYPFTTLVLQSSTMFLI